MPFIEWLAIVFGAIFILAGVVMMAMIFTNDIDNETTAGTGFMAFIVGLAIILFVFVFI